MKKLLTFILIFSIQLINGQASKLPQITPPSPEAAALGKFVETPVSFQTGIPSIGIPLYTLEYGGINVPVSLNYHAGGIKVSENASWVGLGWSLSAGGLVTRQINGLPDNAGVNSYYSNPRIPNFHPLEYASNADYQADIFVFNFGGYSGKFYLNRTTLEPVLHEYDDLKISKVLNNSQFSGWIIKTPDGIEYYFGKNKDGSKTATSQISTNTQTSYDNINGTYSTVPNTSLATIDTWYLAEIYNPSTNRRIEFTYALNFNEREEGMSGTNYRNNPFPKDNVPAEAFKTCDTYFYSRTFTGNRQLSLITAGSTSIEFVVDSQSRQDIQGGKSLKEMTVKHKGTQIKKYGFAYGYFTSSEESAWTMGQRSYRNKRMYLDKLYEWNSSSTESNPPYEFTYNRDYNLPDKLSSSTDFWGYYNAKNNGLTDFPYVEFYNEEFPITANPRSTPVYFVEGADRSVNRIASQACMLTKIKNPLGGTTEYLYESNRAKRFPTGNAPYPIELPDSQDDYALTADFGPASMTRSVFHNPLTNKTAGMYENAQYLDATYSAGSRYVREFTVSDKVFGQARIEAEILGCGNTTTFNDTGCYFSIYIKGVTDPTQNFNITSSRTIRFLPPGIYRIEATRVRPHVSSGPFEIIQDFTLTVHWKEQENIDYMLAGGQRIKEIVYRPSLYESPIIKKYTYEENDGTTSGHLFSMPINKSIIQGQYIHSFMNAGTVVKIPYDTLLFDISSNSHAPMASYNGSSVLYETIKEEYTSTLESGYTSYRYSYYPLVGSYNIYPYSPPDDYEWKSGKLLNTKWYQKKNNTYSLVREQQNTYENMRGLSNMGISVAYGPQILYDFDSSKTYHEIQAVPEYSKFYSYHSKSRLKTTVDIDYFSSGNIEKRTEYSYSTKGVNLIQNTVIHNSEEETIEKKQFYPADIENINSLPGGAITGTQLSALLDSKAQNNIATPVQIEEYKNSELLTTERTLFKDWDPGTGKMILPDIVQSSKGSGVLETRVRYNAVDPANGKPLEVQQEDGRKTCYVWGYGKSLPVAKIENIAYAAIPANLVDAVQAASDASPYSEQAMLQALDALRAHPSLSGAMASTFTHRPLVGMVSATDPKGDRTTYEYDAFNRLKAVRDSSGKLLTENEYHYKNQ